jgi:hypothetical protein
MRLSGLVVAAILLISATLPAQHSSGAGGGSSSGGSHGSYSGGSSSGGSVSSASSHAFSSSASHAGSASTVSQSSSTKSPSSRLSSSKENAAPEKQSSRSFFHPFRKAKPVQNAEFKTPVPCLKAPCGVCPRGQSRNGACALTSNACSAGQSWNGFSCGVFNNCNMLAEQLVDQRRQMQSQSDYGQSLRYRLLQNQYDECMMRSRLPFGAYAFNNALLFDTP